MTTLRWTSQDLEVLPDNGKRYEVVDGELYVSRQPHLNHQIVCGKVFALLENWSNQTQTGMRIFTPGLIFADDDDVVPDGVWISYEELTRGLQPDGKLPAAPRLVCELLASGVTKTLRD